MIALFIVLAVLAAGLLFQQAGNFIDSRRYPAAGSIIRSTQGAKLHVYSEGSGPAVVFEAGISGSSLSWSTVQPLVAQFARAVVYDRAGLGWSSGTLTPRTVANMVSELSQVLQAAQIAPPYVLVGHSFGCLLMQAFAHTHPEQTVSVILVDPVTQVGWADADPRQLHRLSVGTRLSRRGALLAHFGIVRAALSLLMLGGTRIPKLMARTSAGAGNSVIERLIGEVRKLPAHTHPIISAHWSKARSFASMAAHLESLPASAQAALAMPVPAQIPLTILSAATATAGELAEREAWVAANAHGQHIRVDGTGHWLQLDKPELVTSLIRDALIRVR